MKARAVFLVGFMGSGKNTVGHELARRLGWSFVDLDERIEAQERRKIPEIFQERGETGFRQAETSALQAVLSDGMERDAVVALGGGAFVQEQNRRLLRGYATVFLDAAVDELWQRCQRDPVERPLRKDQEQFARLYAERLPLYRMASLKVETGGKELPSICEEIERALRLTDAPASLER